MKLRTRLLAVLASGTLCALTLVANPAHANSDATVATATWLAGDLSNGKFDNGFGGSDYGLALDAYYALDYADVFKPVQGQIIEATRDELKNYITGNAFGDDGASDTESTYAGATAKALVAAQTAGKNAADFGGVNLVKRLESVTGSNGQIKDDSDYGDYANVLGQSYAVQGLNAADSSVTDAARDFLLDQQCANGSFRLAFSGSCEPDTDATGTAVSALIAARSQGLDGVDASINQAVAWLLQEQGSDGSFGGGDPATSKANSNSTGLAAKALGMAGERDAAARAGAWIASIQVRESTGGELQSEIGAIALDRTQFDAAKKSGITPAARSTWRRASAQAIYGLFYLAPGTIIDRVVTKTTTKIIRPKPVVRTTKGATVVVSSPVTSQIEATTDAGRLGQYLAGRLSNGDHVEVKDGSDTLTDYDLTADTVLGLRQLGQQGAMARRATAFLFDPESIDIYAHGTPFEKKASYAAPLAKLIIAGKLRKKTDPKVLKHLTDELIALQQDNGSFKDDGQYSDRVGDPERQALATIALRMVGAGAAADKAVAFIQAGQCDDGGFGAQLGVACESGDPASTGWALQGLSAASIADFPAGSTLADRPSGWGKDRTAAIESATRSLSGTVHIDGSVRGDTGAASIPATAAVAAGRQAAGLDTHAAAVFVGSMQTNDGGLSSKTDGKKGDLVTSIAAAPAIASGSLIAMPGSGLVGSVPLALEVQPAPAKGTTPAKKPDDFTISRPVAYAGGGALGILFLAALGIGVAGLTRKGVAP